jgi:hypothetical protein
MVAWTRSDSRSSRSEPELVLNGPRVRSRCSRHADGICRARASDLDGVTFPRLSRDDSVRTPWDWVDAVILLGIVLVAVQGIRMLYWFALVAFDVANGGA